MYMKKTIIHNCLEQAAYNFNVTLLIEFSLNFDTSKSKLEVILAVSSHSWRNFLYSLVSIDAV